MGAYTGWTVVDGIQEQIDHPGEGPQWTVLAELFVEGRVANTEGMMGGALEFVAAPQAAGEPPADRSLREWAEELGALWVHVIDNEMAYWGDSKTIISRCWFSGF